MKVNGEMITIKIVWKNCSSQSESIKKGRDFLSDYDHIYYQLGSPDDNSILLNIMYNDVCQNLKRAKELIEKLKRENDVAEVLIENSDKTCDYIVSTNTDSLNVGRFIENKFWRIS